MVGDGSYLMMAQEIVTAVAGGHQARRRARAEPRLRLDRRAVGVARLAAVRHQLPLPHRRPAWTATSCRSTSPPTPRASARDVLRAAAVAELRTASPGPGRRRHHRRPRRDRPAGPSPTSTAWWDVPVAEVSALDPPEQARDDLRRRTSAASALPAPRRQREGRPMRTIDHWINGRVHERSGASAAAGVRTRRPASSRPRSCWLRRADVDAAVARGERGLRRRGRRPRSASGRRCCSPSASWSNAHADELAAAHLRRARQGAQRRARRGAARPRGRRVRLRHPAAAQGRVLRPGLHRRRRATRFRQPLGVVAGITPFNFPAMVPMWMYPVAIACGNTFVLKPSERDPSAVDLVAELLGRGRPARRRLQRRPRRQGGRRRAARPPRRRRGLLRRLHADRQVHPRAGHRARQARPGARRRQEPRDRPARRRPRLRRRPPGRGGLRLGRRALHGHLRGRRGRRRRRRAGRRWSPSAAREVKVGSGPGRRAARWARVVTPGPGTGSSG